MTISELLQDLREDMDLFDADASRGFMSQGAINRMIFKIEDLI